MKIARIDIGLGKSFHVHAVCREIVMPDSFAPVP